MKEQLLKAYKKQNYFMFLFFSILFLFYVGSSYYKYIIHENLLTTTINENLTKAASVAPIVLGKDFFDKATHKDAISASENLHNMELLNQLATALNVTYIYTMIEKDHEIYFTSSSATKEDIKNNNQTAYFDKYEEATPLLRSVLQKNVIAFEESKDHWGEFRTILIPLQTKNGHKYIVGADINIEMIQKECQYFIYQTLIAFFVFIAIMAIFFLYFRNLTDEEMNLIKDVEDSLQEEIKEKTEALNQINLTLEQRVEEEVEKNYKQYALLQENLKLASMGSMISNIIHQWKQPLNYISIIAGGTLMKLTLKSNSPLSIKIKEDMEDITKAVERLDQTLNTFQNYLTEKKERSQINLQEAIEGSLVITGSILKSNGVTLKNKIYESNTVIITTIKHELSEVLINLFNNAKDALLENQIEDPWIKLTLTSDQDFAIITVEDNGGGIPQEIMPNIFKEYFTTKEFNKGTGLGLYMSKRIIEESLGGELLVANSEDGAIFTIKLPLE